VRRFAAAGARLAAHARGAMATPESPYIGSPRPVVSTLPLCQAHQMSCVLRQTKKATVNEGR
jgi:hypothetical protein